MMDPKVEPTPTASQMRAARAMLGWSVLEASRQAGVSIATAHRVETLEGPEPRLRDGARRIRAAYEAAGVTFAEVPDGGRCVTLRPAWRPRWNLV